MTETGWSISTNLVRMRS